MKARPLVAVLPGDGIGPEATAVAVKVLQAAGFEASFSFHAVGWREWCESGEALPASTLAACRSADAVLFGAITSKPEDEAQAELVAHLRGNVRYRSPILRLRKELDLYANIRPCQGNGMDLVLFRENTEGLYAGFETSTVTPSLHTAFPGLPEDAAVSLRVITPQGARRICEAAFSYAQGHGRKRVTLLEKANVLRETGGLMRREFYAVARQFPGIVADELHIDAACARVVSRPGDFDVVVATNLFGDIFSDVAAEVSGGLPLAASASVGSQHLLFEPVHGSAPDIAGRGLANPLGAVKAAAMMASRLGQQPVADRIESALARLIVDGQALPRDMGGTATTLQVQAALLDALTVQISAP
ncbi:MAG: isocitrate/isopropylmalate dehydrogenase family protein [Candidatus Thermoplasmatota archaeon]|jgi:3-isopropylmalate dehydrogenase